MKNILFVFLLISTILFGQQNDKKWDKVIALEKEGKVKSANSIVNKIYKKSVTEKDEVQMTKCFFYQSKFLQVVDEDAQTKILNNLKTDINRVSIPSKAILNLVYAKCLSDFHKKEPYFSYNRIDTTFQEDNFKTWTDAFLISQIETCYKNSLENEIILKKTSLTDYETIFDYSIISDFKNQTLYDYALAENINYFSSKVYEWEISKSEYYTYKKELLGSSTDFVNLNFDFIKNTKLKNVLILYQKLEKTSPTFENQWNRIQFCKKYMVAYYTDYPHFLNNFQKNTDNQNLIQKIQLEKALFYSQFASKKNHSDYKIKAVALLDSILSSNIHSNTYKLALQEKTQIQAKYLSVQLQKNSYIGENTRALIYYNNVNKLKISFYKINQNQLSELQSFPYNVDIRTHKILENKKPIVTQDYILPEKKDYFQYSTEVLLPALEKGSYVAFIESDSDTKTQKAFSADFINITNITVSAKKGASKDLLQTLDRKTGIPLENVTIKLPTQTIKTDKNGLAFAEKTEQNYYNDDYIQFATLNDTLAISKRSLSYLYGSNNNLEEKPKGNVKLYLDRAIYRPGQTIYFKGIAFQKDKNITSVVKNTFFKIVIIDPDYKKIKEFEVTSNEFGSFSGEFILPKNGRTGSFTLKIASPKDYQYGFEYDIKKQEYAFWNNADFEYSQTDFKVEEYKRPKFEIKFDPVKESYQIEKEVKLTGLAKAFAGSSISNAKVEYHISAKSFVFERGGYYYKNGRIEPISEGKTQTDSSGKFEINFIAKTFEALSKEDLPIVEYIIKTTVTDINGETQTAKTAIKVGYHNLVLNASVPNYIVTKNENKIKITSTNLNGEFIPANGDLKIYLTNSFSNKFKERIFQQPEIETISKEEFERLFPFEKIENIKTDELGTLVYSRKFNTEKDKEIALDFMSEYKSGNYVVVLEAFDTLKNKIVSKTKFSLSQSKDKPNPWILITAQQINKDAKKDGFAIVKLTSTVPNLFINIYGSYHNISYYEDNINLQNNQYTIKVPIKNYFENAMNISFQSVYDNQLHSGQIDIPLKTEEKKLEIDIETFRSKIDPGKNENWSFKVNAVNTSNEAEVLASMYDSSLDQFNEQKWPLLQFQNLNYSSGVFKSDIASGITINTLQNLNLIDAKIQLNNESNPKLMWFGFNFNDSFTAYQQREYQKELNKKLKKPSNTKLVFGVITDSKNLPIPKASVQVKGTQRIQISDNDGYYEIEAGSNEELVFSSIGFKEQSIFPENKKNINIKLIEDVTNLNEIVEVGYGALRSKKPLPNETLVEEDNSVYNTAGIDIALEFGKIKENKVKDFASGNAPAPLYILDGESVTQNDIQNLDSNDIVEIEIVKDKDVRAQYGAKGANGVILITTKKAIEALNQVKARKNLSETALFLPNLKTDSKGKVSFNFTSPEALTAWKLRLLAHNKEAVSAYLEKNVITQKELMILPNFPRFFREKDTIVISAKISNVTAEAKTGIASLQFFDAVTMTPIDVKMNNAKNIKNFTAGAFGNTTVTWKISIPENLQGIQYKILAKSGRFSDGEENIIPVLTNNMLVTESIPIWVRENSTKQYTFENLKNNTSSTLKNHQLTLEYTSNPTWIAIQSLPYLMEYEHECSEQTFARFYANVLASEIISNNPKVEAVFENWRKNGTPISKLEENEELKSILLAETPWLNDTQTEDQKKKNLALLFDLEKMKTSQEATFEKLKQKQKTSGGFSWFDGSEESKYITRHILAGLGHLSKLTKTSDVNNKTDQITKNGIPFLDTKFLEHYKNKIKDLKLSEKLIWVNPYSDLHYLYTRSFYLEKYPLSDTLKKAVKLYLETAKNDWINYSIYEKGLAALTLNRFDEKETAKKIIESLKETSSNNEDSGMYWIANKSGWYWYQSPIETQALLIEAFAEVNNDKKSVDAMKIWLLKNKQAKNWPTTKSTTEAVYALLTQGTDWLSVKDNTVIKLGDEKIVTKKLAENEKEAEMGYIKLNWKAEEVKKEMASINIQNKSKVPGFGGVYWQYFEDLDKIKSNLGSVLSVSKELYLKKSTSKGDQLEKITSKNPLKIGDLVTVRLIITSKEDAEYIHLKDMRASCFEPINVLSKYQYKDRLGYFTSTKDAATHFFFDQINKGTYVIEYDIRVNNGGEFSNGITTIQSMYAPEFASHTKGIRVKVQ
ncbi:MAG: MG2 domain-containing protein [Flavobacterium sp.]